MSYRAGSGRRRAASSSGCATARRTSIRTDRRAAERAGLLALTAVAAATDALTYLRLHVFPANMTGNTVLIAIGLASHRWRSAALSALALAGFVTGAALAGGASARLSARRWAITACAAEAATLGAGAALWAADPAAAAQRYLLVAALGAAMGVQSATITQLQVGVSTTYITGTWTAVSKYAARRRPAAASREDRDPPHRLQAAVLACYFATALVAAVVYRGVG